MKKEPYPMRVINLCRHKNAGWDGVIYLNENGEVMVTDGAGIWSLTPQRMKSLEFVEKVDMEKIIHYLYYRQGASPLIALLREQLPDLRQDIEYLSRPLLEDVQYDISDTRVKIHCPDTCFAEAYLGTHFDRQALLDSYREVMRTAKAHSIRISYSTHIKRRLKDQWEEYEASVEDRARLFRWFSAQARVVELRGLHQGCIDDKELSLLTELQNRIIRYGYRNSVISQIASAAHTLETLRQDLSRSPERFAMIAL